EEHLLISVVDVVAGITLTKCIRRQVPQELFGRQIFIVATNALRETLWRNDPTEVAAKLEGVIAMQHRQVINDLIVVLDAELRCIWIGTNVQTKVVKRDVRKHVKPRESESRDRETLR